MYLEVIQLAFVENSHVALLIAHRRDVAVVAGGDTEGNGASCPVMSVAGTDIRAGAAELGRFDSGITGRS